MGIIDGIAVVGATEGDAIVGAAVGDTEEADVVVVGAVVVWSDRKILIKLLFCVVAAAEALLP